MEVTFVTNGGTSVTKLENVEELPTPLPTTTKSNNIFVGWFYDSGFEEQAYSGDELTANITLYAKWYANMEDFYEDVANEIRIKNGETNPIKHADFAYKIKNIQGAKAEETKTVTPNFASGNVVITPDAGKVLTQVTVVKDNDLVPENIVKDVNIFGVVGTVETGGDEIISLMATREYYAIKTGTQSSALRWECSTELFNKPIFIDANGNLYTPAQVGVYFNGTYKTRADTTLYTFGTYSTTMTGRITFKTVSGGIIVSLINLDYSEELWGTGVYFYFSAYISWSVGGGTTGVSLQTQWASICSVQKTWLNNFSDITDGYFSDSAVIDSIIIANGGAIGGFSMHLEDPD